MEGTCFSLFPGGSDGKESAGNVGDLGSIPGLGRSLEKGMATHSSILAWRIPWTEEPGGLQSRGLKKSETTERLTLSLSFTWESACNAGRPRFSPGLGRSPGEGNGNPLQYSCLENPMDRGAWRVTVYGVVKSWT